ncbi:hypothetical protein HMPREF9440_01079, partial [Sutterella parvirubra YIT 11816]
MEAPPHAAFGPGAALSRAKHPAGPNEGPAADTKTGTPGASAPGRLSSDPYQRRRPEADVCGCFEDSLWDGRRAAVPHEASTSVFYGRTGSSGSSV